jgi:tetratricopeptide (TPR) repeat protein
VVTTIAVWPALRNGFVDWDDPGYVTDNRLITDPSLSGLGAMFHTFVGGNYHPLTIASYSLYYRFWKLDPEGYHITNLVLHVLTTLAVFWFVRLLTGRNELSAITSIFFGAHPLHVESVAWVSGRKDVLYALFYVLSCITYVFWLRARTGRPLRYAGSLALFLLSLLSKGMAVTLPVALLAIDFYMKRRVGLKKLLLEKAPFILISVAFACISVVAQAKEGAIHALPSYAFYERVLFACYGIVAYIVRAFVPVHLSAFYPYPLKTGGALPPLYYLAPLGTLAIASAVYVLARKDRTAAFGGIFFLANVALVLQLFPVGSAVIADRYTYLSYVGVGLMIASLYRWLARGVLARAAAARTALIAVLLASTLMAVLAARARCEVWKDNISLWTDVLARYPDLPLGYTKRARTYAMQGDVDRARADVEKALALDPRDTRALTIRGTLRFAAHDNQGALADLEKSVGLDATDAVAWNGLGGVRLTVGQRDQAVQDFDRAIALDGAYAGAYLNRALALRDTEPRKALADLDVAIRLRPDKANAYSLRSEVKERLGDRAGAQADAMRASNLTAPEPNAGASTRIAR